MLLDKGSINLLVHPKMLQRNSFKARNCDQREDISHSCWLLKRLIKKGVMKKLKISKLG